MKLKHFVLLNFLLGHSLRLVDESGFFLLSHALLFYFNFYIWVDLHDLWLFHVLVG